MSTENNTYLSPNPTSGRKTPPEIERHTSTPMVNDPNTQATTTPNVIAPLFIGHGVIGVGVPRVCRSLGFN